MAVLSEWMNRLRYFSRRSRFEDDLDVEIQFHIETRAAELQTSGLARKDAIAQARREFGSMARMAEDTRGAWQFRWIEDLAADLRYGLRSFRRSPGFALTAILSLALGIGANAAIFNAIYTVLWKPLPVSKPDELMAISVWSATRARGGDTPLTLVRQLQKAAVFQDILVNSADGLSFSDGDRAERVVGEVVSPNYFELDKGFPVFNVKTFEVRMEESLARERILANLSGAVGLVALALAAVGLYGILAYSVSRRTREVGIRMALGSSTRSVLWMVVREAVLLIAAGSVAGVTLSVAGWKILAQEVPGVSPVDAPVLAVCAAIMLGIAAAAVTFPALRACRIDPLLALRQE